MDAGIFADAKSRFVNELWENAFGFSVKLASNAPNDRVTPFVFTGRFWTLDRGLVCRILSVPLRKAAAPKCGVPARAWGRIGWRPGTC